MKEEEEHGGMWVWICRYFLQCVIHHKSAEVEEKEEHGEHIGSDLQPFFYSA